MLSRLSDRGKSCPTMVLGICRVAIQRRYPQHCSSVHPKEETFASTSTSESRGRRQLGNSPLLRRREGPSQGISCPRVCQSGLLARMLTFYLLCDDSEPKRLGCAATRDQRLSQSSSGRERRLRPLGPQQVLTSSSRVRRPESRLPLAALPAVGTRSAALLQQVPKPPPSSPSPARDTPSPPSSIIPEMVADCLSRLERAPWTLNPAQLH